MSPARASASCWPPRRPASTAPARSADHAPRLRLDARTEDVANPAQTAVIEALANTLLERDRYTGKHSESVVELARGVARQLGIAEREIEIVAAAALLHDIGKVAIPDAVLHKPGALTPPSGI